MDRLLKFLFGSAARSLGTTILLVGIISAFLTTSALPMLLIFLGLIIFRADYL